jgi:hypothetical protein
MPKKLRRFEILLPLQFNDGSPVPDALIGETIIGVRGHFGAVSLETQIIRGSWRHEGMMYEDQLARMVVDAPDTAENTAFITELKETLKQRFRQIDIWVTSYVVDVM